MSSFPHDIEKIPAPSCIVRLLSWLSQLQLDKVSLSIYVSKVMSRFGHHTCHKRLSSRPGLLILPQAAATRLKPKDWANAAGSPWMVTSSGGVVDGRALRSNRCSHERRQCARCVRVKTSSPGSSVCTGSGEGPQKKETVSLRSTFTQVRRIRQRGQSLHNRGKSGGDSGASSRGKGETEGSVECGQNTALTRRGLRVELLS